MLTCEIGLAETSNLKHALYHFILLFPAPTPAASTAARGPGATREELCVPWGKIP